MVARPMAIIARFGAIRFPRYVKLATLKEPAPELASIRTKYAKY